MSQTKICKHCGEEKPRCSGFPRFDWACVQCRAALGPMRSGPARTPARNRNLRRSFSQIRVPGTPRKAPRRGVLSDG